jgi:hypothetical protein
MANVLNPARFLKPRRITTLIINELDEFTPPQCFNPKLTIAASDADTERRTVL